MALTPPRYRHGDGVFVASKGKCSLLVDTDGDGKADKEIIVAEGWKELPHGVDALGVAVGKDGSVYFGLGTADFTNAYLLKDGTVTVADAQNCRVLVIHPNHHTSQIGTAGDCVHDPPHTLTAPNGDTPLANGDLLVSEVNGSYIDEFTQGGHLVWSTHIPIVYPSDPQQLGADRYLVADYTRPGGIYEFNRSGKILWAYHPRSGPGMLDHPSLAEQLPNGLIATNDDYRDRVVIINPKTKRIVWQYGRTDSPGTGPGRLNTPDGFDLLAPDGTTPTHAYTG
jgi:hypothetical protein